MSHTKYHTEALILGGVDTGEADRFIQMLTRDFGLLGVHARSLRKISSKQRPYLQNLTFPKVSLVRGRNIWRLVHVEESKDQIGRDVSFEYRLLAARISRILKRFIKGEEFNPDLFDAVKQGLLAARQPGFSRQEVQALENLIVLRTLYYLGYVAKEESNEAFFENHSSYNEDMIKMALSNRNSIEALIYLAVEQSGL